jgi:hypothetical protein
MQRIAELSGCIENKMARTAARLCFDEGRIV